MIPARGPILAAALVAIAAAALLWLAFGSADDAGAAAAPDSPGEVTTETPSAGDPVHPEPDAERPVAAELEPRREQSPRERSAVPPVWSAPLRGRVVDERTGQGVPQLVVEIEVRGGSGSDLVLADEDGRFESHGPYQRSRLKLTVFDALGAEGERSSIASRRWRHDSNAEELRWSIDIGPTYRAEVLGGGAESAAWKARLREVNAAGEERIWSWVDVDAAGGGPGWIRYRGVEREPDPEWRPRLQVTDELERWSGETPVPSSVGQYPRPIQVVVEPRAGAIQGTVTDVDARPVQAHVLLLLRHEGGERAWVETGTDGEGGYALEHVPPGVHRLMVRTDHRPVARFDVVSVPGEVTVRDVVLSRVSVAGDVTGALVGPPGGGEPFAAVQLEALDGGATNLGQTVGFNLFSDPDGEDRSEFAYEGLHAGRYRLRVISIDGRRYDRAELDVGVPAADVFFVTRDGEGESELDYVLTVRDAPSGKVLPEVSVLWRIGPIWLMNVETEEGEFSEIGPPFPIDVLGVVSAPGHLPALFTPADYARADDTMRLDLALQRGHGGALVILDAEHMMGGAQARLDDNLAAEGLPGARVVAGGRVIGTSDDTGLALLDAPAPIESFDVRAPGWAVFARMRFQSHAETPDGIGFVLMARE